MAVDPHCFDADPDPDPAQNLPRIQIQIRGGGGGCRSAKNVHPPWPNPRYAPGRRTVQQSSPPPSPLQDVAVNLAICYHCNWPVGHTPTAHTRVSDPDPDPNWILIQSGQWIPIRKRERGERRVGGSDSEGGNGGGGDENEKHLKQTYVWK